MRSTLIGAFPGIGGVTKLIMALEAVKIDLAWQGGLFVDLEFAVHNVIQQENARGKIEDVIGAARRANPDNAKLAHLEATWLKTAGVEEKSRLEAMVIAALSYTPAEDWSAGLQNSYKRVCRIEREADGVSFGTGFLVAEDLVITNYHVLYGTRAPGTVDPMKVHCRFDAIGPAAGRVVKVAQNDWVVAKSEPAGVEWQGPGGGPSPTLLDFALVRLAEPAGRDAHGDSVRGFVKIDSDETAGQPLSPVFVLQHPLGASLQICLGAFNQPDQSGARLYHTATTQRGSSGSPCLSMGFRVVGLHNGGSGGRNSAIPLSLIAAFVNTHELILPAN